MFEHLIGLKVNVVYDGAKMIVQDPEMDLRLSIMFSNYRYRVPGRVHTMEFRSDRTNIDLDANGFITRITVG